MLHPGEPLPDEEQTGRSLRSEQAGLSGHDVDVSGPDTT